MKKLKLIISLVAISLVSFTSCDVNGLGDAPDLSSATSANLNKIFDISTNNSGNVKITPIGEGITKSTVLFGDGTGGSSSADVLPGQSTSHTYPEGNYTVTIKTYSLSGEETTTTYPLVVTFSAPTNIKLEQSFSGTTLSLSATADNANGIQVLWGDGGANEVPTTLTGSLGNPFTGMHNYAPGVYTLTVKALSGGAATSSKTFPIVVFGPFSLPVTYENPIQNYNGGGSFGGADVAVVDNPSKTGINTSEKVWRITKNVGAEVWAGTYTPLASPNGVPINIDNGSKFKIMVYSSEIGKSLHFQLEDGNGYTPGIDVPITVANQWQELTFDFSAAGIPAGKIFNQYVFQYNLAANGSGEIVYVDNITQTK
ncbi:hypothetical protein SAMN05421847_1272 [Halpernia humi]|uniref:PKD domain-containing protein n=1 Tax=Halpernia humi TaxID=493375 RepID=A0A1H5WNQ4_9FLAO|nr:hypothetical protein SAMN05421847_1272 [Halpernia humi]